MLYFQGQTDLSFMIFFCYAPTSYSIRLVIMLKHTYNTCVLEVLPTFNSKVIFKYFPMISCATQQHQTLLYGYIQSDHAVYVWAFIFKKKTLKVVVAPAPYGRLTDSTLLFVHVVTKTRKIILNNNSCTLFV